MNDSKTVLTYLATIGIVMFEEIIKHPIGTLAAIIGLMYTFERWRTQRIIRRIKEKQLEYERSIRNSEKRKEGS